MCLIKITSKFIFPWIVKATLTIAGSYPPNDRLSLAEGMSLKLGYWTYFRLIMLVEGKHLH